MKVRCINIHSNESSSDNYYSKTGELTIGKVYDGISNGRGWTVINDTGIEYTYFLWRFEPISDIPLPPGWKLCQCGATTTNPDKCCECKSK
jgi:hypothetical protein